MDASEIFAEADRLAREEVPQYRHDPTVGTITTGAGTGIVIWLFCMFAGIDIDRVGLPAAFAIALIAGGTWLYLRSIEKRYLTASVKHQERLRASRRAGRT